MNGLRSHPTGADFAKAISAEPDALVISPANTRGGYVPLDSLGDTCAAVVVADDVLAVDSDDDRLSAVLMRAVDELEAIGYLPVISNSGRPAHRHLFARVGSPQELQLLTGAFRAHGFDVRRGGSRIRPPLVPHRQGHPVSLAYPADPQDALTRLLPPSYTGRVSEYVLALLHHGRHGGAELRYASDSEAQQAIATGFVNAGMDGEALARALLDPSNAGGRHAQRVLTERGTSASLRDIRRSFVTATEYVARMPRYASYERVVADLARIEGAACRESWQGALASARAVLEALLAIGRRSGKIILGAAVRELAELAGVGLATASRALDLLVDRRYVERVAPAVGGRAAIYALRVPAATTGTVVLTPPTEQKDCSAGFRGHDVFRYLALGKAAADVYALLDVPRTSREVAAARGTSVRAVRRQLAKLTDNALIAGGADGTYVRTSRSLDEVARELGVDGEREEQRARHAREREGFYEYLEHRGDGVVARSPAVDTKELLG